MAKLRLEPGDLAAAALAGRIAGFMMAAQGLLQFGWTALGRSGSL